ncbi:hypothetical protein PFISCL1PPCAC_23902, partial [Pristionchus fissidentatus]
YRMNQTMHGQPHGPIFSPFVMEAGVDKKPMETVTRRSLVPGMPDSSRASGVRPITVPRQRYRVIQPVMRSSQTPSRNLIDARYRRPKPAHGEGEVLGANASVRSFVKTASLLPTKTKKRIFYEDGDDETLAQRVLAQREPPPKLTRKPAPISGQEIDDRGMQMHIGRNIEVPAQPSTSRLSGGNDEEFEEVDIDGLEEDAPQLSPNPDLPSRMDRLDHLRGASLRDGGTVGGYQHFAHINKMRATTAAVKQLNGENSYLKDQLDACYYRIKQLETLLMDRNVRLKQLLSENLKQSTKIRRLEQELGEDAAHDILSAMENEA